MQRFSITVLKISVESGIEAMLINPDTTLEIVNFAKNV